MSSNDTERNSSANKMEQATQMLEELASIKVRAENAAVAAEQANNKANSESGFAFNAKENSEEHAKAIAQVRGTVDAISSGLATTKANAEESAQVIRRAKISSESDLKSISNTKSVAEQEATLVAVARENAEKAFAVIGKVQAEVSEVSARANDQMTNLGSVKTTVETISAAVHTLQEQVEGDAAASREDFLKIRKIEDDSQLVFKTLNTVTGTAKDAQARVVAYEGTLADLKSKFDELHAKTEALLPGATSAGLATSFRIQKARFDQPQKIWLGTFVITVFFLLVAGWVGLPGFWPSGSNTEFPAWDLILRHFIGRLPLVAPLVWLGVYAGRNYMLTLRMQEEYAFKEAISATFEGYKREMAGIQVAEGGAVPLVKLCEDVLHTLAQRPGRIYESRQEDITPLAPLTKVIEQVISKALGKAKGDSSKE